MYVAPSGVRGKGRAVPGWPAVFPFYRKPTGNLSTPPCHWSLAPVRSTGPPPLFFLSLLLSTDHSEAGCAFAPSVCIETSFSLNPSLSCSFISFYLITAICFRRYGSSLFSAFFVSHFFNQTAVHPSLR